MITLLKDIKVDLNRYIMFMNGKIQYSKAVNAQINIKFKMLFHYFHSDIVQEGPFLLHSCQELVSAV